MTAPNLSTRGIDASISSAEESQMWEILSRLWHPNSNPTGHVSLGVAENCLAHNKLRQFLTSKTLIDPSSRGLTYGDGPSGSKPIKATIASFVNNHFNPLTPVKPDHIMVTNGCTAAIEHCSWALANPGEGVLLGRPYYRAFLADIGERTGVEVVTVTFGDIDPCGSGCVAKYEEALLKSKKKGVPIRALILCHPHNPLGRCYSRGTIIELMRLCQKYKVNLISDEIYALSVWKNTVDKLDTEPVGFESALSIDLTGIIDPSLVHVLWGISKDFGANGIRLGCIISQSNPTLLAACRAGGMFSSPSSLSENAVKEILSDTSFVEDYITTNQDRISAAYSHAVHLLSAHGIEHMPGVNAAFFLWINLGKKYVEKTGSKVGPETTGLIFEKLLEKRVFIVHGNAAGAEEPGWFRLVFSQPPELVEEGIKRISAALD